MAKGRAKPKLGEGVLLTEKAAAADPERRRSMAWTTPVLTEVCVGMEVTSYASAEI
ncbi:MAG: pyrroloquinoline quinone precursor peptide PqqA [Methylobacteriaceae bacterium]|nr:pyrroloquinoline quinone precursor peptide PqqA [Methylobacteriaceae bacterium]MBV9395227.1 pyrroloquinoline quinone precursor peptide PqqA [Methylobacteriaceae bacterium]